MSSEENLDIALPAAALRDVPAPNADAPHGKGGSYECPPEIQGLKVLVVDDSIVIRRIIAQSLSQGFVFGQGAGSVAGCEPHAHHLACNAFAHRVGA